MLCRWVSLLFLFPALALAQAAGPAAQRSTKPAGTGQRSIVPAVENEPQAQPATGKAADVPPDAPVITINGLCEDSASNPGGSGNSNPSTTKATSPSAATSPSCKTIITRAQFDHLAELLNVAPPMRRQLATVYPRLLLFASSARKMGLQDDPRFQEMMKFATLQILAQEFTRAMQKKAGDISEADLQKYYQENGAKFEQAEVQRIFIPNNKQQPATTPATSARKDPAAEEAAMKALAQKLQQRAAAGEDFTKLQKEAFSAAGIQGTEPNVSLGKISRGNLPVAHDKVFDLKPGQVSDLISDAGGYYIYKVISKQTIPFEQAKSQIRNILQAQRMQESMDAVMSNIHPQFNQDYFTNGSGEASAPGAQNAPSPRPATQPAVKPATSPKTESQQKPQPPPQHP